MIQKLMLIFKWPFIKFISIKGVGGLFCDDGEDLYLFNKLNNIIFKNNNLNIIEINKPSEFVYSVTTLFSIYKISKITLLNTKHNIFLTNNKNYKNKLNINIKIDINMLKLFGLHHLASNEYNINKFNAINEFVDYLCEIKNNYYVIIIKYEDENTITIIKNILNKIKILSILIIYNNNTLFRSGNQDVRVQLINEGYVYLERINMSHDYFVISNSVCPI
jgi:hypothetical protein